MFTGIVEEIGNVKKIVHGSLSIKLSINCSKILEDVKIGDSIAVNGICLTVVELASSWFTVDVMPETMRMTSLNRLNLSDKVNLERALKLSDRLGGHIVSGHIDGAGIIKSLVREDNAIWISVEAAESVMKYIIYKGSVALDGTSLTIACADESSFKVSLIPHTAGNTVLGLLKAGDKVNVECDVIGKYVERLLKGNIQDPALQKPNKDISIDFLRSNGFI